jgi:hypothetical protein|tara:strand:- start:483 stop:860 length:378 start_codon:yes stop_codon:yes gene_type:complete
MAVAFVSPGTIRLAANKASQKVPVVMVTTAAPPVYEASISSPTIEISKNGGAYAAASDGTWTEVSDGDYTVTLNATDTDTVGWLMVRVVKTGAESRVFTTVGIDPAEEIGISTRLRRIFTGRDRG